MAAYLGKRDSGAEPSQTTWWASDSTWSHVPGSARPGAAATPDSSATASSSAHAPQDSRLEAGDGADALVGGTTSPVLGSTCPTSLRLPWRDRLPLGSHLASASHAHAVPVRLSVCLIGAIPASRPPGITSYIMMHDVVPGRKIWEPDGLPCTTHLYDVVAISSRHTKTGMQVAQLTCL